MPGTVLPAFPVDVLPRILAAAFSMELRLESLVNNYADGATERAPLAQNTRRYFSLTLPLTPTQRDALWNFYLAHKGLAFYIYNPRETIPPFSYDPTGGATVGRYTVVFDGMYSETTAHPRAQAGFNLREVA